MAEEEINKDKEIDRIKKFYNQAISDAATIFVKNIGVTLLGWKGVEVNVVFNPDIPDLMTILGGPVVQIVISIDQNDSNFKKVLFDAARSAKRFWNPVETPTGHKVIKNRGDKVISKKGEPYFVIPMKFCEASLIKSLTLKGPDGVSVTIEDKTGRRLESDLLFEARIKLSTLIQWDNREKEE